MVGDYNMSRTVSWWGGREAAREDEGSGRLRHGKELKLLAFFGSSERLSSSK